MRRTQALNDMRSNVFREGTTEVIQTSKGSGFLSSKVQKDGVYIVLFIYMVDTYNINNNDDNMRWWWNDVKQGQVSLSWPDVRVDEVRSAKQFISDVDDALLTDICLVNLLTHGWIHVPSWCPRLVRWRCWYLVIVGQMQGPSSLASRCCYRPMSARSD